MPNKTEYINYLFLCRRRSYCPAGNYTVRFGALNGSGRKTVVDEIITLQQFLQNSVYISYQGKFICGKVTPVYGE